MVNKKEWKLVEKSDPIDLKLFEAHFEYLVNPRNDLTVKIVRLNTKDACNTLCIDQQGYFIFVRQMRFGTMKYTLELPGGLVDEGEDYLHAAQRELAEETGFTSESWTRLADIYSNSVYLDSKVIHWLAVDAVLTEEVNFDDAEDIEIVRLSSGDTKNALKDGRIDHPHTISALAHYFLFYEKELS